MTTQPRLNIFLRGKTAPTISGRIDLIMGSVPDASTYKNKLFKNVQAKTEAELDIMFETNTILRNTIANYLKINRVSRLDVRTFAESGTGVASVGKIGFSGTASADASIEVSVVSAKDFKATIDVANLETHEQIAQKVVDAFVAGVYPNIPVVATRATGDAVFTAKDLGTIGNLYGLRVKGNIPGITITLTAFADGLNNPTFTEADFPSGKYSGVLIPGWMASHVDTIAGILDARFNSNNAILDGRAFFGFNDTYSNLVTLLNAKNSKSLVIMGNKLIPSPNPLENEAQTGASILHPIDWAVAEFMAIRSLRLEEGEPIADYVVASGLDNIGGASLASLPYHNTPMVGVPTTPAEILFKESEIQGLESVGFTVLNTNLSETGMLMGAVLTTYKFDTLGVADKTFRFLNFVDTGSICREFLFNNMKADLAQMRLTEGDLVAGRNIQNPASLEALVLKYYGQLANATLTQAGATIASKVSEKTVVELSLADRLVNVFTEFPIVTQLGTMNMIITQVFTVE